MSSFDAIVPVAAVPPAEAEGVPDGGFTSLCPFENADKSSRHVWRPLCAEPGAEGARIAPPAAAEAPEEEPAAPALEPVREEVSPGFAAGYELGREEARAEIEGAARELARALSELAEFRGRIRHHYERELLSIALSVARKIVRAEVTERPEIWLSMIGEAVRQAVDRHQVIVRIPPALASFLREHMAEIRAQLGDVKDLAVVEDPALEDGGCVIETRLADLDVGLDTQLDQVSGALTEVG